MSSSAPDSGSSSASREEPTFLFADLAVEPPVEEFDRVYAKKVRSFESGDDSERAEPYRRAYQLGKDKLAAQGRREGSC